MIVGKMEKRFLKKNSLGQVWIETAIYTLIGLTIIAIVLSVATPQIQKMKERAIIKQTITALYELDKEIKNAEQTGGTVKIVQFKITRGKLDINSEEDKITYTLENTKLEFSEEGKEIEEAGLTFKTEKYGRNFNVILELDYSSTIDITYNGNPLETKTLQGGGSFYNIQIKNLGADGIDDKTQIDFEIN